MELKPSSREKALKYARKRGFYAPRAKEILKKFQKWVKEQDTDSAEWPFEDYEDMAKMYDSIRNQIHKQGLDVKVSRSKELMMIFLYLPKT